MGDLFEKSQLQTPMMVYTATPFLGPELAPMIGGFINSFTTWRWSFYFLIICRVFNLLTTFFLVPETYEPVLLHRLHSSPSPTSTKYAQNGQQKSIKNTLSTSLLRPFQLFIHEPMLLNLCIYSTLLLGILYLLFGAFPQIFSTNHRFNLWQIGLTSSGMVVGITSGACCDPLFRRGYRRLVERGNGRREPEYRLPPAVFGSLLVPVGLFVS